MERESMSVDVVIVGAGPAGLAAACRMLQLAEEHKKEISLVVLEKGSEVGAHILSGAILEPGAIQALFPNWKDLGAPLNTPVTEDSVYQFNDAENTKHIPDFLIPTPLRNEGNYIVSLGNLCRWLAEQAQALGAEVFPGFAAAEILYNEEGGVSGVATGDMGLSSSGEQKDNFEPGFEFHAKYTLFAEGCRGHLGKQLIERFELDKDCDPQHYAIGLKELWDVPESQHKPGTVVHTLGWPLEENGAAGGGFLYHLENNQVAVGLIVDLNYSNTYLSPFDEFQRYKHQPTIKQHLEGGKRVSYGARAISKGGFNSLPKMTFPGGLLIGCDAGTLNFAKIKGSHTAIQSGMLAAETVFNSITHGDEGGRDLTGYIDAFKASSLHEELYRSRNFGPAIHRFGLFKGAAFNFIDQNLFGGRLPITLRDNCDDFARLQPVQDSPAIEYPKPDGKLSFDKPSSVFLSNTNHEEDQPCHLKLKDKRMPIRHNLPLYDEPAQRYCPAGVYEVVEQENGEQHFQINAQNCVHCKTCDIKDPSQNITWVTPEGGGGPNYPNM